MYQKNKNPCLYKLGCLEGIITTEQCSYAAYILDAKHLKSSAILVVSQTIFFSQFCCADLFSFIIETSSKQACTTVTFPCRFGCLASGRHIRNIRKSPSLNLGSGSLLQCKSLSLCCGVGLLSSYISGWLASVTMPTCVDGSKVCFWRLYSDSWMSSDPLSGDSFRYFRIRYYIMQKLCICAVDLMDWSGASRQ